ncbi:MAG: hypothetical protein A2287_07560 [Candidatus Melainabacteria bacterium RIFOXYA12_FULL_32_12]|nr:MAG: hypothetical protein A2104_00070 [Candidatus Melainabacteria bacterium GWF2_32_7]OGI30172.1 MAG: hypothetical protein A2287_07560 [Candidatus Melainabacteria bacterium RIFOXYA12_FULL_32_12]
MSIGPRDMIDRKLVQIYSNVQTNNLDIVSTVDPEKIMKSISLIALNNKIQVQISQKIKVKQIA